MLRLTYRYIGPISPDIAICEAKQLEEDRVGGDWDFVHRSELIFYDFQRALYNYSRSLVSVLFFLSFYFFSFRASVLQFN
jgi:hypothetical protein